MIIECLNCNKKFEVNPDLIPVEGRNIQCGSCNHVWFFKKEQQANLKDIKIKDISTKPDYTYKDNFKNEINKPSKKKSISPKLTDNTVNSALVKFENDSSFTISKFLSYILVSIISFICLIIVLDTFKTPLYNSFPNLEFWLFGLFEILKDIKLFIIDLI